MKKVLWLIVCLMAMAVSMTSCGSTYLATANYEVCYPDGTRSYKKSVTVSNSYGNDVRVGVFSFGGTNYIGVMKTANPITKEKDLSTVIASSTAPMRLTDYKVEKLNGGKPNKSHYGGDGVYF